MDKIYNEFNSPEYFNFITSIAMCFFGFVGLFVSNSTNILVKLLQSFMFLNGITSLGYHWTILMEWKIVDEISMTIITCLCAYLIVLEIIYKICDVNRFEMWITNKSHNIVSGFTTIIMLGYLLSSFILLVDNNYDIYNKNSIVLNCTDYTNNITIYNELLFPILFGTPIIIILICTPIMRYLTHIPIEHDAYDVRFRFYHNDYNDSINQAYNILYLGIGLCVFFTIADQIINSQYFRCSMMKYIGIHGFWHIGMSNGLYMISQFIVFISANNNTFMGCFKIYDTCSNKYNAFLNILFPIVYYVENMS